MQPRICVSIVSHRQADLVELALADLARASLPIDIIVTINAPEAHPFASWNRNPPLRLLENSTPKGFAANHNAAFALSRAEYFCVLNPDVRLPADPFPRLLDCLGDETLGVVAPKVLGPNGAIEDSARAFPTPLSILAKGLGLRGDPGAPPAGISYPDWVAGMFMLFPRASFERAGGFDEAYFLYYEDVDLCARLRKLGYRVGYCADTSIVHDARRTSRKDARYAAWHLSSMLRFFGRRAIGRI
jgi:N-acetylglucosaminyl-diphospho-decaprenol L-rhamnosyltransferase